jgi:SH3-like domain-containing protein
MIPAVKYRVPLCAALLALASIAATPAQPQFMSISRDKAYLREGPTYQHRVLYIYQRKELPVQVIATYDVWRRIRDHDGTVGWMHESMLSARRTVLVTSKKPAAIRRSDKPKSKPIAFAQAGVVAKLEACEAQACEISASGTEGWIQKKDIWGVRAGEVFR